MGQGVGGAGVPPKFGKREKFGQSQFLKKFACVCACCFFFSKRDISCFKLKSVC